MSGGGIPTALLGQSADTVFAAFGGGDAGDLVDVHVASLTKFGLTLN